MTEELKIVKEPEPKESEEFKVDPEDLIDPGAEEGTKVDPRTTEPPPDHPRFHEVYGKMKGYERELESLKEKMEEKESVVDAMKNHNDKLVSAMEGVKTSIENKDSTSSENPLEGIQGEIHRLSQEKVAAMEELEHGKVAELDEKIMDLKIQMRSETPTKPDIDPKPYDAWIESNSWFNDDPLMRGAAISVDDELSRDPVWGKKSIDERLAETGRRVTERFGYTEGVVKDEKPKMSGVEGASKGGSPSKRPSNVIRLSQDEMRVASGLGISPEEFASQKALIGGV